MRELNHRPRKRFSQSFLSDQRVADGIVRSARLTGTETVLEIGPGLGVLTQRLIRQAARVVAVEIDRDLAARLAATFPPEVLTVIQLDALELDPDREGLPPYRLVANLPYHITSPIMMRFLHEVTPPDLAVLMVQREVAERITAPPGDLTYLSIAIQCVADVEIVRIVPPTAFVPRPKVQSAVLRLRPDPERLALIAGTGFLHFVRAGFTQPRKRLGNSLAQGLSLPKSDIDGFLREQGLPEQARPHELTIDQWRTLSKAWGERQQ